MHAHRELKKWGVERTWVNSSADWGSSDPLSLVQVARHMKAKGFTEQQVTRLLLENPLGFYGQSGRFSPDLNIPFVHPREYQR